MQALCLNVESFNRIYPGQQLSYATKEVQETKVHRSATKVTPTPDPQGKAQTTPCQATDQTHGSPLAYVITPRTHRSLAPLSSVWDIEKRTRRLFNIPPPTETRALFYFQTQTDSASQSMTYVEDAAHPPLDLFYYLTGVGEY